MVKKETYLLAYEDDDADLYADLKDKSTSPFFKKTMADIFLFAVCIARMKNIPGKSLKNKRPNIPLSVLGPKKWLFYSLSVSDSNSHKAVFDEEAILHKAEELANSGIKYLHNLVFNEAGDPIKHIELMNKEIA